MQQVRIASVGFFKLFLLTHSANDCNREYLKNMQHFPTLIQNFQTLFFVVEKPGNYNSRGNTYLHDRLLCTLNFLARKAVLSQAWPLTYIRRQKITHIQF